MAELGRLITAMVTPFNAQGDVNYAGAKKLAQALLESGSDGLAVAATTGEGPTLSHEEKLRLFAEVKAAIGGRGAVIANTGNYSTAQSVSFTKEAEAAGVDAIMAVVPYYNKPPQSGLYEHFKAIAGATRLPCIVYNVPSRTVTNLAPETVIRLSQIDNLVGIKEASGNFSQIARIIKGARPGFRVWSGNDEDTFGILNLGGYGVISVVSHLVGRQLKDMIEACVTGRVREAADIHHRILPLINSLFVVSNPIPLKHALNCAGFPVGKPRLPLTELDQASAAIVEETLKRHAIDLPVSRRA